MFVRIIGYPGRSRERLRHRFPRDSDGENFGRVRGHLPVRRQPGLQRRSGIGDVGGDTRERERLWHKLGARHRAADVRFCAVRRRRRARGAQLRAGYRNRVRHPSGGRVRVRRRLRPEPRRNSVRWCVRRPIDGHRRRRRGGIARGARLVRMEAATGTVSPRAQCRGRQSRVNLVRRRVK